MVLVLKDKASEKCLEWYFGGKKECPPLSNENSFLAKSAVDLAASIKNGELTATRLIEATMSRMKEVNGVLNAIVDGPFLEALNEANAIDHRIANNQIPESMLFHTYCMNAFPDEFS